MGLTITQKILAAGAGKSSVKPGENVWVDVDKLMIHDVFGPDVFHFLERHADGEAQVLHPDRIVVIPDHYIFTKDERIHQNRKVLEGQVKKYGIANFFAVDTERYSGVSHITLAQTGTTVPGTILLGTDSHTCTAGAFGMFATGIGVTDAAFVLATGKLWLKVPEAIRIEVQGEMRPWVMAKDLILHIIGETGVGGAAYKSMEFFGTGISALSIEERMTVCNMAIEAGAKNGIMIADEKTEQFLAGKTDAVYKIYEPDEDAEYLQTITVDASKLKATIAKPHSPDNKDLAENLGHVRLDRAYIGSCTGGKMTDFKAAAKVLFGKKVAIDTVIVPATVEIERNLQDTFYVGSSIADIFKESGCRFGPPSCGACFGGPLDTIGRASGDEVVISTTNRNFPGRMGSKQSSVYLASPYTAAASAIVGSITDPKEMMVS